jgi:magnesium transporter
MTYFTKKYHTPGTPPGTLTERVLPQTAELKISLIDYSDTDFIEKQLASAEECQPFLKQPTTTWIHIQGQPTPETLQDFAQFFELHPLALEDILNTGQRPKMEAYDTQLFVITSLPVMLDDNVVSEQISIFAGTGYIISFHMGVTDPFEPIRKRLRNHSGKIRSRQSDYLLYCLLDVIIDEGFPVLESFGEEVEALEEELLEEPGRDTLRKLHAIKRELLLLRRMLWPQREVFNRLIRDENELLNEETTLYLRDCYDHTVQIMDLLETYRDMTASMLDVYLSSISYRLNDVMRVLTVIATIFIPLTFIVGVYGMNFSVNTKTPWAMPELYWYYGYPLLWFIMIAIAGGMILFFKRKGWF